MMTSLSCSSRRHQLRREWWPASESAAFFDFRTVLFLGCYFFVGRSSSVLPNRAHKNTSLKNGPANSDGKPLKFKRPVVTRDQHGRAR